MRFPRHIARLACVALIACALLAPASPVDAARPLGAKRALRQSDDEAIAAFAVNSWGLPVNTWKAASTKSSSHVLPRMQEHHTTLHRTAHGWIEGYVPKEYAPLTAAIVSYVLLVLPFCAAYAVFKAMDALLSIQKLLLAINVYNACYCALLVVINLWTGNEPMASLQESNEADYLILQFFKVRLFYFIFVWAITCRLTWFFFNLRTIQVRGVRRFHRRSGGARVHAVEHQGGEHEGRGGGQPRVEPVHRVPLLHPGVVARDGGAPAKDVGDVVHPGEFILIFFVWAIVLTWFFYLQYTTMFAAMAFSHYVKPDKGERAMAAQANAAMAGNDENKQF